MALPQSLWFMCVWVIYISSVTAQNFGVPSAWRKPTINLSLQDRLSLVDGLLGTVNKSFNSLTGQFNGLDIPQSANMISALAIGDQISNSTVSKEFVLESLNATFGIAPTIVTLRPDVHLNSDVVSWGLAAMDSYRAYGDFQSLQYAKSIWMDVSEYMVTPEAASAGKLSTKNATFSSTCGSRGQNISTAGAVFYYASNANDTTVNGATVAGFMALSAHLYEETSDTKYLAAAELTANFVTTLLYDGNVILDKIVLQSCSFEGVLLTFNSGLVIDGLSVLQGTNSSWAPFVSNLVSTAVTYPYWTNTSDGIIIEGPATPADANVYTSTIALKGIFIRSLYEAYSRMQNDSAQATFIRSFISLNALLDLASAPEGHQYSPRWEGPRPTQILPWGQLAALDVLTAAVGLGNAVAVSNSTGGDTSTLGASPTTAPSSQNDLPGRPHGLSGGAIGGIVAGIVVLMLIILAAGAFFVKTRKRNQHNQLSAMETAARPYSALGDPNFTTTVIRQPMMGIKGQHIVPSLQPSSQSNWQLPDPPSRSIPDSVVVHPTAASWDGNNGSSVDRPSMVELTVLRSLVERINRVLAPQPTTEWVENEQPPRYES
ncbi:hypothetical protein BC629DRAFT_1589397 [Irpex lacteus]|nr:hypothetical protein BC629DRAFT_1589397 [Irpex lacteus]